MNSVADVSLLQQQGDRAAPQVLFLSQGRASASTAMGHVRVEHALRVGLAGAAGARVRPLHATVPRFSLAQRVFIRAVPGLRDRGYWTLRWHLARGWAARRLLEQRLRDDAPDVVHVTTDQVSLLLGRIQREVPCVLSLDITTYDWLRLLRRLPEDGEVPADLRPLLALERRALHRAPLSIAWTDTVAERVGHLAPRARVATLHPGIDLEEFRPRSGPRKSGPLRVLFIGGRWVDKGGPDLVAALEADLGRTVELHVVTSVAPPPQDGMIAHAAQPGSREIVDLLQHADVLCLPSYADAVPWVIVEALACGVPIVATAIGSIPEMMGSGSGRLVDPGDVPALREALHELFESPALRSDLAHHGRARAEERFDARRNTERLVHLLEQVRRQRPVPAALGSR